MMNGGWGCTNSLVVLMGVARSFQRGGGGHTGSNNIVMAFSPRNIVGYLLKKRLTKGGSQAPQDPPPPRYAHGCTNPLVSGYKEKTTREIVIPRSVNKASFPHSSDIQFKTFQTVVIFFHRK